MNDPVSEELERNAAQSLPWRPALALAIGFHVGIAIALFLGPARRPRPRNRRTARPPRSMRPRERPR